MTQLQKLIGLSMFKNDKGTMDHLAKLHTVGSVISPLVYELEKSSGLTEFLQAYKPIWKAVDKNPKLCDSFVR